MSFRICSDFRVQRRSLLTLDRTRTCGLLILSLRRSRTGTDREGHGETKPRFYPQLSTSKGTGTDRERHGVVVPLWYEKSARWPIVSKVRLKLIGSVRAAGF